MDYTANIAALEQAVAAHAFLRPIALHRLPDGTLDRDGNLTLWNRAMEAFVKTPLWPEGAPGWDGRDPLQGEPCLVYIPAPAGHENAPTILVAHGGGFLWRTGCEGPNVAWYFHRAGYHTAILSYRLLPYDRHAAIADMQRAIRLLRTGDLGPGRRIIAMGFSAGGMLSGNCAVYADGGDPAASDPVERLSSRLDACVVGYGAMSSVSFPGPFMADPNEPDLFGVNAADRYYLATEKHITPDTPPFFIWQTLSDDGRHGLCLAKALQDAGVPYELHIFEGGVHGLAMADGENDLEADVPHIHHWGRLCTEWLALHGLGPEGDG